MKKILSVIFCVMMLFSIAACSNSTGSTEPSNSGNANSTGSNAGSTVNEAGEVVVTLAGKKPCVNNLDHYQNKGTEDGILEGLWGDPLFYRVDNEFFPVLAEGWEWADDHLSITFTLKQGIKFHDGSEMTAEDVKVSFERILGNELCITGSSVQAGLDRVEVVDDYTCTFYFAQAYPGFFGDAAGTQIISAKAYNADPDHFFEHPVATGAWMVDVYDGVNGHLELVRNPNWWGWGNDELAELFNVESSAESNIDRIIYTQCSEASSRIAGLQSGDYDFIEDIPVEYVEKLTSSGLKTESIAQMGNVMVGFNCGADSIFNDINLRKAVSLAIDREGIVNAIALGGKVMNYVVPEGATGYNADVSYQYNAEEAKALVEASSYDGSQVTLLCASSDFSRETEVVQAIQSMLKAIGIDVYVNQLDSATYQTEMAEGNYDMVMSFYIIASGDPYKLFNDILYNGGIRGSNYINSELDAAITTALATLDETKYAAACQDVLDIVFEEYANYIAIYSPNYLCASASELSGVTMHPQNGWIAKYITVN